MKKLFDLEATLVESKSSLGGEVAGPAYGLEGIKVAVISGGRWGHFQTRLLAQSPGDEHVEKVRGGAVEGRGSQTSLPRLGRHAPLTQQQSGGLSFAKSRRTTTLLEPLLPATAIPADGTPPIDVTEPGIANANGVGTFRGQLAIDLNETHVAGNASLARRNDTPVQGASADSVLVGESNEAARVTRTVIARPDDVDTQTEWPARE